MGKITTLLALALISAAMTAAAEPGIQWESAFPNAQAEAQTAGKPIMVDVYSKSSKLCRKFDREVSPNAAVMKASSRFVAIRIDAQREGTVIATKYGVHAYPTILFLTADGTVIDRIDGYVPPRDFIHYMDKSIVAFRRLAKSIGGGAPIAQVPVPATPRDTIPLGLLSARMVDPYAGVTVDQGKNLIGSLIVKDNLTQAGDVARSLHKQYPQDDLGSIYNAIGDAEQLDHQLDGAWGWYSLTVQSSHDTPSLSHAYLQIGKYWKWYGDNDKARMNFQAITAMPDAPGDDKTRAQALLDQLSQ